MSTILPLLLATTIIQVRAESITVGQNYAHVSGAQLRIEAVDYGPSTITLDVSGRPSDRTKNLQFFAGQSTLLIDDRGNRYQLVPLTPNDQVKPLEELSAGAQSFTAHLVFNGPLVSGAKKLTLVTNVMGGNVSQPEIYPYSATPRFSIDLPLPHDPTPGIVAVAGSQQGTVIAINAVRRLADEVEFDVTMTTGESGARLDAFGRGLAIALPDGSVRTARPDPNLPGFHLPAFSRISGTLHFDGALPAAIRRVTLLVNPGQTALLETPVMRLDVPVPEPSQQSAASKPI